MRSKVRPFFAALLLLATLGGPAAAEHLPAARVIDPDQLRSWMLQGKRVVIVDSRVTSEYRAGHIPGAISIPFAAMDEQRSRLPSSRETPLIFYCNGWPQCKKSHDACTKVIEWGYVNVHWLRDGLPAWEARGLPLE